MRTTILNQEFPDLYKFSLYQGSTKVKDMLKAKSSELSDPDFVETDFKYFQDKIEFGSPDLLNELVRGDKELINSEGESGVEKYLSSLFPTLINDSGTGDDIIGYYSSLTKIGGDEIYCLLIPELVDKIKVSDSKGSEAIEIRFDGVEVRDSKVLWIVTSYSSESPRKVNLSYEAYKGDRDPVKKMSDYVLRNDGLTENWKGYSERDGYLYSSISGSLIGTSRIENRPIYNMMCRLSGEGWNRAKRYSIGDTVKVGDTMFESVEMENIGNHPYYSRMWVRK